MVWYEWGEATDKYPRKREGTKIGMDGPEKMKKRAELKKRPLASYSQELTCKIPSSYKLAPEIIAKVREVVNEDASNTVARLKVLSDPIRIRILKALYIADLCVCVFAELLDCHYSKLSYHLKLLKDAGLIEYTKEGNFLIYRLTAYGRTLWEQVEKLQVVSNPTLSSR